MMANKTVESNSLRAIRIRKRYFTLPFHQDEEETVSLQGRIQLVHLS